MAFADSLHQFHRSEELPPLEPSFWTWAWVSLAVVTVVGLTIAAWYVTIPNVL